MTKRGRAPTSANPNLLPVPPTRGLAGSSASSSDNIPSDSARTTGSSSSHSPQDTPSSSSSQPPSSSSTRPRRQTRSTKPANLAQLPTPAEIRKKREWTVVGEPRKSADGKYVTVRWKDTVVPVGCLHLEEKTGRTYVRAGRMKHYIQKKSHGEVNDSGQAMWHCVWEEEEIPVEWLKDLNKEDSSASDSDSTFESDSDNVDSSSSDSDESSIDSDAETASSSSHPSSSSPASSSPSRALFPGGCPSTPRTSIESSDTPSQQHRSPTTSSLFFGDPPVPRPTELNFAVTSGTANYGPVLQTLVESEIGKKLKTTKNRPPKILARRKGVIAVRPLHFKRRVVGRKGHEINLQIHQNAEAILVHVQGDDVLEPCNVCKKDRGVMQGCVVAHDFGKGECTNCHYGSKGTKCCFRKDTKAKCGYRAAKVVKRRAPALKKSKTAPARPTPPPSSPPQAANPSPATLDVHRGLQFSDRDFVHGATTSPRNSGDAYVMSGGLGDMAVTPIQASTQQQPSRSRSRSIDSSEADDMPLTKRFRPEVIDLITPEKPTTLKRAKTEPSSAASGRRSSQRSARAQMSATADGSPPSSPLVTLGANTVSKKADSSAAQHMSKPHPAFRSPEFITSGHLATSSAARLKHRKQLASKDSTAVKQSKKKKTTTPAAAEEAQPASPGPAPESSTTLTAPTKQADSSRPSDARRSTALPTDAPGRDSEWRTAESAVRDMPKIGVPSKVGIAAGIEASSYADRAFMSKRPSSADAGYRGSSLKPRYSSGRVSRSSGKGEETMPPPPPQKQKGSRERKQPKSKKHGRSRRGGSSKSQRASSSSPNDGDVAPKNDALQTRIASEVEPAQVSGNDAASKPSTSAANSKQPAPPHQNADAVACANSNTITNKLQHSPPAQPSNHVHTQYPGIRTPSPHRQASVFCTQRFARDELTATRFSYIWHRSDSTTQELMRRLLRWAWHEGRAPVAASLADFFSRCDEEREWLNDHVVPTFCPPKARERVMAIELDGSSDGEDADGMEGYVEVVQEGDEAAGCGRDVMVLPAEAFGEDSEWEGSVAGSESSSDDDDSEPMGSVGGVDTSESESDED